MAKLYRQVTLTDEQEDEFVFAHKMAMTGENLHSKSEIAYELGVRDKRIAELERDLNIAKSILIKTANNIIEADNCEQDSDEMAECWDCLKEFALTATGRCDT
tara:strand:- start:23 stop:331 length:309 start_codon:yes stop_codon:yes gene_type:complete